MNPPTPQNSGAPHRRPYSAAPRRPFPGRGRRPFTRPPHATPRTEVQHTPDSVELRAPSALAPRPTSQPHAGQSGEAPRTGDRRGRTDRRGFRPGGFRPGGSRGFGGRGGAHFRRPPSMPRVPSNEPEARERVMLPPLTEDMVRVIPLGGVEEVGRNMIAVETPEGIIISDAGFQFTREGTTPGVDYILPNTSWLEDNKDRIIALFITHGHLDHIGGIPFMMDRIGNPPIYTQYLTSLMVKKRQEEFPHQPKLDIHVMEIGSSVSLPGKNGKTLIVKSFPVTHSIPDSMGISIVTKHGNIVISGDLKLEHDNGVPSDKEQRVWGTLGKDKNILFIADSTNAEKDGFSIPETKVYATLEEIISTVKGRLVVGLIASNFERMIRIIQAAEKNGRKVILEGRSVRNNIEIAQLAKLFDPKKGTLIQADAIKDYPSDRIVILCTGAQGEDAAALMRIATKKHKYITFNERDTVILSSSVIPGNELGVQKLKDNLLRHGLSIIHYRSSDVHSTGHGNTGELVWMRQQVNPNFFMPAYGFHSMLRNHANAQVVSGFPREKVIIPDNGTVVEFTNGTELKVYKEKIPSNPMMVDGFAIGDMQEVVIRDRQALAKDGMFVIIATVNLRTGTLKKSPDIISRGFVYLRESQGMLAEARLLVKKSIEDMTQGMNPVDLELVKQSLTDNVERYLFQKTSKRPMVIPVLIGV
ncbi:MAG: ribonuclease J [Candidatus Pacebacteria bacterium]|nr:ribonuclease J [Candidatus Paceibacterota bacterium]